MNLVSKFFRGDSKLEACLMKDAAHVVEGATGDRVRKIQMALFVLDGAKIKNAEVDAKCYGPSTATAVLAYKRKRRITNYSYQTQADNIVGKMTVASLDKEMYEYGLSAGDRNYCASLGGTKAIPNLRLTEGFQGATMKAVVVHEQAAAVEKMWANQWAGLDLVVKNQFPTAVDWSVRVQKVFVITALTWGNIVATVPVLSCALLLDHWNCAFTVVAPELIPMVRTTVTGLVRPVKSTPAPSALNVKMLLASGTICTSKFTPLMAR